MKHVAQASLLFAASGTALIWILPYVSFGTEVPTWILSRWALIVCAPAALVGLGSFVRFGGFAKTPAVIACVALASVGIAWTDPTEIGRGALLAAGLLVTLPLAALIRRYDYLIPFLRTFSITTVVSLIYAFVSAASFQGGTLVDPTGTSTTNVNSLGIQAGLAALFLAITFSWRRQLSAYLFLFLMSGLVIFSVTTASRTAFLALAGAFVVATLSLNSRPAWAAIETLGIVALCAVAMNAVVDREHPFYQGIFARLIENNDETRDTLGDRTHIWSFAAGEFASDNVWLYGVGTGGVDKVLGRFYELNGRTKGKDGIWRLYAHNTLVWWALAFGISGIAVCSWLGISIIRAAHQADKKSGDWRRSTLVTFVALAGSGGVITQESSWCVLGAALLAILSTGAPGLTYGPLPPHFNVRTRGAERHHPYATTPPSVGVCK